jgi:hypothetical protein
VGVGALLLVDVQVAPGGGSLVGAGRWPTVSRRREAGPRRGARARERERARADDARGGVPLAGEGRWAWCARRVCAAGAPRDWVPAVGTPRTTLPAEQRARPAGSLAPRTWTGSGDTRLDSTEWLAGVMGLSFTCSPLVGGERVRHRRTRVEHELLREPHAECGRKLHPELANGQSTYKRDNKEKRSAQVEKQLVKCAYDVVIFISHLLGLHCDVCNLDSDDRESDPSVEASIFVLTYRG